MTFSGRLIRAFVFRNAAVVRAVARAFPNEPHSPILDKLGEYKKRSPGDAAFTRLIIIELSNGDSQRLRELVDLAKIDVRDVLVLHPDHLSCGGMIAWLFGVALVMGTLWALVRQIAC